MMSSGSQSKVKRPGICTRPFISCLPPCQSTAQPVAGGTYTAFSLAQDGWSLCGLTSGGAVSCWSTFSGTPSVVSLPEPMANISVGYILGLYGPRHSRAAKVG
jgi:hypothetical protein